MRESLSVIIPNYNNSRFINQCVESIINQTYHNIIEIIIVDDCSTDDSKNVIIKLAEKYSIVKPIFLNENTKVSNARNCGLSNAKGKYITFVDADDFYFDVNKLQSEMELIEKYSLIGKDIVSYSATVPVDFEGNTTILPSNIRYLNGYIYNKLLFDVTSKKVMRDYCVKTSLLRKIGGYNPDRTLFEDYELLLKLAKEIEFYYSGNFGTAYRNSQNGLSKRPKKILESEKQNVIMNQINTEPFLRRIYFKVGYIMIQFMKKQYKKIRGR